MKGKKERRGRRRSVSAVLCQIQDLKCWFVSLVSSSVLPTGLSTLAWKRGELKISCAACKVIVCIEGNRRPQCLRIRLCVSSPPGIWSSHCRAFSQESSMQTAWWPGERGRFPAPSWVQPVDSFLQLCFQSWIHLLFASGPCEIIIFVAGVSSVLARRKCRHEYSRS